MRLKSWKRRIWCDRNSMWYHVNDRLRKADQSNYWNVHGSTSWLPTPVWACVKSLRNFSRKFLHRLFTATSTALHFLPGMRYPILKPIKGYHVHLKRGRNAMVCQPVLHTVQEKFDRLSSIDENRTWWFQAFMSVLFMLASHKMKATNVYLNAKGELVPVLRPPYLQQTREQVAKAILGPLKPPV